MLAEANGVMGLHFGSTGPAFTGEGEVSRIVIQRHLSLAAGEAAVDVPVRRFFACHYLRTQSQVAPDKSSSPHPQGGAGDLASGYIVPRFVTGFPCSQKAT